MTTASVIDSAMAVISGGFREFLLQCLGVGLPLLGLGMVLHGIERILVSRLTRRLGWKGVLVTGWLGTPIHEMSHVIACLLFRHRVVEVKLFDPDPDSGTLGYVRHSYDTRSTYQRIGTFFIGVAPLLGGSAVLYGLLVAFDPGSSGGFLAGSELAPALSRGDLLATLEALWVLGRETVARIVGAIEGGAWSALLFVYLTLCVGSHLAPSPSDYRGGRRGLVTFLLALLLLDIAFIAFGGAPGAAVGSMARIAAPVVGLLALAVVLSGAGALLVVVVNWGLDRLRS